jgi:hypothetical protein
VIGRSPTRRFAVLLLGVSSLAAGQSASTATPVSVSAPATSAVSPAVLEWRAAKEEGVYGYLVYRADDREGPFRRLGTAIVHVSQDPGEVHSYRFADTTVEAGKTYYYYLDTISRRGEKSRFSGVVTKVVPAASPPAP